MSVDVTFKKPQSAHFIMGYHWKVVITKFFFKVQEMTFFKKNKSNHKQNSQTMILCVRTWGCTARKIFLSEKIVWHLHKIAKKYRFLKFFFSTSKKFFRKKVRFFFKFFLWSGGNPRASYHPYMCIKQQFYRTCMNDFVMLTFSVIWASKKRWLF